MIASSLHSLLLTEHATNGLIEAPLKQMYRMKDLLLCVLVVVKTLNLEISRCYLADYVKELSENACRTCRMCSTIIFPHSTNQIVVFWRRRCRCRRPCLSSVLFLTKRKRVFFICRRSCSFSGGQTNLGRGFSDAVTHLDSGKCHSKMLKILRFISPLLSPSLRSTVQIQRIMHYGFKIQRWFCGWLTRKQRLCEIAGKSEKKKIRLLISRKVVFFSFHSPQSADFCRGW